MFFAKIPYGSHIQYSVKKMNGKVFYLGCTTENVVCSSKTCFFYRILRVSKKKTNIFTPLVHSCFIQRDFIDP